MSASGAPGQSRAREHAVRGGWNDAHNSRVAAEEASGSPCSFSQLRQMAEEVGVEAESLYTDAVTGKSTTHEIASQPPSL
jgi:hypothetical protein